MRKYLAQTLASLPLEQVWQTLTGKFVVVFADGEHELTYKEAIYNRYFWEFHNLNPGAPILKSHCVTQVLKGERAGMNTHLNLINTILWDVYDACRVGMDESQALSYRYELAALAYQITNKLYNDCSVELEEYVTTLDILDFLEVFDSAPVQQAYERAEPTEQWIADIYSVIDRFLSNDPSIRHNTLSKLYRSSLVSGNQLLQCVGPRGFVNDLDGMRFQNPVMRGYFQGIRSIHDYIVETRTAAMSLNSSKGPLQETEYFSRKLQIMCQVVERLHHTDCGTTRYLKIQVRGKSENHRGDLPNLVGVNYLDDDGVLKSIKVTDRHLIGKTIQTRSVIFCNHPDHRGVCSTCYGQLSEQIPKHSNLGQMNCTHMTEQSASGVLSSKHLAVSSTLDTIVLDQVGQSYLKVASDGNSYMLADVTKNYVRHGGLRLLIAIEDATNLADIQLVERVTELPITRVSELTFLTIETGENQIAIDITHQRRQASLTHAMLEYILKKGITTDETETYFVIDMAEWDWSKPILSLPLKHFSMSDHAKDIATILESSVSEVVERDRFTEASSMLLELFSLVNEKLSVNMAVLSVTMYAAMIRSAEHFDYALPKPHTESGLGVMKNTILYRSMAAFMAYERHSEAIFAPESYYLTNRTDHPFDAIMMPKEVIKSKTRSR